jgi:hypothetical protein
VIGELKPAAILKYEAAPDGFRRRLSNQNRQGGKERQDEDIKSSEATRL